MENKEKKKSKVGIIILIIILILLILFAVWFFLLKDKKETDKSDDKKQSSEKVKEKKEEKKEEKIEDKKIYEYDYKDGVLTEIVDEEGNPLQDDFVIDGIILVGNRHSYDGLEAESEGVVEKLVSQGYKKEGINSSFYLNEWIEFYLDTKYTGSIDDVKILVVPHMTVDKYEEKTYTELEELALEKGFVMDYAEPDSENYNYIGNNYVNMDYEEGKYDILFTYKNKIAYFITIDLIKEPN